jgi:hypothetical protein
MIIDHRTYDIVPRKTPAFMKVFMEKAVPIMKKYFGEPVGIYLVEVGPQNQLIHMWSYENYGDMEQKRSARDKDPEWGTYLKETEGLLVKQETKIIRPKE